MDKVGEKVNIRYVDES